MKKTIEDYVDKIMKLPVKSKYDKSELLVPDFLVEKEGDIEIYYAPHNDYINPHAKIFIVGITPGFQQMSTAMAEARKELEKGTNLEKIKYLCKKAGRFSGSLRKNIISMLDELKLNEKLDIKSCSELFEEKDNILHTVSLIPYSVFVKKQNYSGHTPKLLKSKFLMNYVRNNFVEELRNLDNAKDILIIPLGRAVEDVLLELCREGLISEEQILIGFPHPSGANVNRAVQFNENKEKMIKKINKYRISKDK